MSFLFSKPKVKQQSRTVTEQQPEFPAEALPFLRAQAELFGSTVLPLEQQRLSDLVRFISGQNPANIVAPVASAVRQAQAATTDALQGTGQSGSAGMAPGTPSFDDLLSQAISSMRQGGVESLAPYTKSLISPQLLPLAMRTKGTSTTTIGQRGGGPSGLEIGGQLGGIIGIAMLL